jgi:MerR family transcriptional regulator, light-induced transcriptional regulator
VSGLSILAVSRLTHLTADTIRAWEKRYCAVRPARAPGGQRVFSDEDVSRLRLLREAVVAGQSISNIAGLPTVALHELVRFDRQVGNDVDSPIEHLLRLLDGYDFVRLRNSLFIIGTTHSTIAFFDGIIGPLREEIEYSADDPHARAIKQRMLAEGILSVSAQLFERYAPAAKAPSFVMSTFPCEAHSAAALLAAVAAAEIGFRSVFLGHLTPAELQSIVEASRPAALGVHISAADADYSRMLAELRRRVTPLPVVAVGTGAPFDHEARPIKSMRDFSDVLSGIWDAPTPALCDLEERHVPQHAHRRGYSDEEQNEGRDQRHRRRELAFCVDESIGGHCLPFGS